MITICKEFNFSASHHLPNHKGLCKNDHGHNYKLFVEIRNIYEEINTNADHCEYGMVADFGSLKELVNKLIIDKYDHQCLNDYFPNPTAEEMIIHFSIVLNNRLRQSGSELVQLKLYETETSFVRWRNESL